MLQVRGGHAGDDTASSRATSPDSAVDFINYDDIDIQLKSGNPRSVIDGTIEDTILESTWQVEHTL